MPITDRHGVRVLRGDPTGPLVRSERDVVELIGEALGNGVDLVVLPAERLAEDFFALRTRVAGEVVQKFVNYRLRLAVVGDLTVHLARSSALRDFVREANRGDQLWFVADDAELDARLARVGT